MRRRAAGRRPFPDLAAHRVVASDPPARGVHVPDPAVRGDIEAAHLGRPVGQRDLGQRQGGRIDPEQAVGAVAGDPGAALGVDLDAVGARSRRRRGHQPDLAGLRIEPADHVAVLEREPEDAVGIEDRGVGVAGRRVRHAVDRDAAARGVHPADGAVLVARVPHVARRIEGHGMGLGAGRQRVLDHGPGRGIEPADQVAPLPGPPDRAVRALDRVARPLAGRRRDPFLEGEAEAARDQGGQALAARREVFRQIGRNGVGGPGRAGHVDHGRDQRRPAGAVIARALGDPAGAVASCAEAEDDLPRRVVGQRRAPGGRGPERGEAEQEAGRRQAPALATLPGRRHPTVP